MRILVLCPSSLPIPVKQYGGIERVAQSLCNEYHRLGHEVILVAHKDSEVPYTFVPWEDKGRAISKPWLETCLEVRRIVKEHKPDIVHDLSSSPKIYLVPSRFKKVMAYGVLPDYLDLLMLPLISGSTKLVGCSNYLTRTFPTFVNKATVYNPVDVSRYDLNTRVADDAPLVTVSGIAHNKGIHNAIKIAKLANRSLIIAGNVSPANRGYFDREIKPHLSDTITYIGPVNDEQKNELLQKAYAFLMPNETTEAFGITMAEAMSCGTPVIGFDRWSISEVVSHGKTGYVGKSIEELAGYVGEIAKIDRAECRRWVESKFQTSVVAERYLDIYREMTTPYTRDKDVWGIKALIIKLVPWIG